MSRKTKAELLVDIDELTTEVKRLKRTLEIRNDNIRMLLDMSDEDQRHLKLLEKAHDDTIDTLIVRRNERDHLFNEITNSKKRTDGEAVTHTSATRKSTGWLIDTSALNADMIPVTSQAKQHAKSGNTAILTLMGLNTSPRRKPSINT